MVRKILLLLRTFRFLLIYDYMPPFLFSVLLFRLSHLISAVVVLLVTTHVSFHTLINLNTNLLQLLNSVFFGVLCIVSYRRGLETATPQAASYANKTASGGFELEPEPAPSSTAKRRSQLRPVTTWQAAAAAR